MTNETTRTVAQGGHLRTIAAPEPDGDGVQPSTFATKIAACQTFDSLEELWGGAMWNNRQFTEAERGAYALRRAELAKDSTT